MVAPSRVHPLTFFGRAPRGTTNTDLCEELVKRFAQTDLRAVQDFGAGRFELVFRTKAMVDRFLADPVLKVRENEIKVRIPWSADKNCPRARLPLPRRRAGSHSRARRVRKGVGGAA
ncbi:hypothetical protein HPB50_008903 [Hyalomma asiaticum]|uniref:Uncharacterized protein n=1 Tax=Hyalomma asiaticum TaxID=266040 RepID=A0ACB7RTC9_HYAAI|nr:hypothetical protein HPB50_008903 [Hyalomma asiaticum]